MSKNSFVTSKFKSYIASCKKKSEVVILETVGKDDGEVADTVYFANGYTGFKCPLWYYKQELQDIFCTDAPEVGKVKTVCGNPHAGAKETVRKIIDEAKNQIAKTDIVIKNFGKDRTTVQLFSKEQCGTVVDMKFLDMYDIEGAEYYSSNQSQGAPIVAKYAAGIEIILLPIFPGSNYRDKVNNYSNFWRTNYFE